MTLKLSSCSALRLSALVVGTIGWQLRAGTRTLIPENYEDEDENEAKDEYEDKKDDEDENENEDGMVKFLFLLL